MMAMRKATAAAEKQEVKSFAVGNARIALRNMKIGACEEATDIWRRWGEVGLGVGLGWGGGEVGVGWG